MFIIINKILSLFISFFILLGSVSDGGLLKYSSFTSDITFSPISADEVMVSEDEKQQCRKWFDDYIVKAGTNGNKPAYNFSVNGVALKTSLCCWNFSVGEESAEGEYYDGGKTTVITLTHKYSGLTASVEATIFEEYATCKWTVTIKNTDSKESGVISDFLAMDCILPTGKTTVYCNKGSDDSSEDFVTLKSKSYAKVFDFYADEGRPTEDWLPYFNLNGDKCGALLGIGWTGNWRVRMTATSDGMYVRAGQKNLLAYLEADESIRSPLVSVGFYNNGNPVKGFNTFRNWVKDCVCPDNLPAEYTTMDVLFVSNTRTAAEILNDTSTLGSDVTDQLDAYWMDAGWYSGCSDSWSDGVGNWQTSEDRFPYGIKQISDDAASKGCGLVLWYEPERLVHGSKLYETGMSHENWIVDLDKNDDGNSTIMWNLAEPEAVEYLSQYIGTTLRENGVTVYRQDFNYSPEEYWQYADLCYYGDRTGIAENHYVTGLYTYLDSLKEYVPGLIIDNCSSGGRRLDLEMASRSLPMWRSDYNCDQTREDLLDATQTQTYGLSLWLPYSGTFANFSTEYAARTSIINYLQTPFGSPADALAEYKTERAQMAGNYYPITCGGTDTGKITAMQFGTEDTGFAVIYRHEDATTKNTVIKLSGLENNTLYTVMDEDGIMQTVTKTGAELMSNGITLPDGTGAKAFLIHYTAVK